MISNTYPTDGESRQGRRLALSRSLFRLASSVATAMLLMGCASVATEPDSAPDVVDVKTVKTFYVTDRAPSTADDKAKFFSHLRGLLTFGVGSVDVPLAIPGQIENRSWFNKYGNQRIKNAVVVDVAEKNRAEFVSEVADAVASSEDRELLLFIHGYNTDFDEAMRRTAQIAWDTRFQGAAVLFSWPSKPSVAGYTADEAGVHWATTHLTDSLQTLVTTTGARKVVLIAHSMGSRALTEAVIRLKRSGVNLSPVKHLVLAAPDIDADVFVRDIAPELVEPGRQVTLYASSRDRALELSEQLHDYPRAGDAGSDVVIFPGIDTVDATDIDTSFLGHNYYGENQTIMSDVRELISADTPVGNRPGIEPVVSDAGNYWRLVPEQPTAPAN